MKACNDQSSKTAWLVCAFFFFLLVPVNVTDSPVSGEAYSDITDEPFGFRSEVRGSGNSIHFFSIQRACHTPFEYTTNPGDRTATAVPILQPPADRRLKLLGLKQGQHYPADDAEPPAYT